MSPRSAAAILAALSTVVAPGVALAAPATLPASTPATVAAVTAPVTTSEPVVPVPATGSLTVIGKGFGHGRGMSQFGAANAAAQGRTWQQITSFYYPGTVRSTTTVGSLRVGLADTLGAAVRVAAAPDLSASDGTTTTSLPTSVPLPPAPGTTGTTGTTQPPASAAVARFEIVPVTGSATGTVLQAVTTTGVRVPLGTAARWTLAAASGRVRVTDAAGRPGATYLGTLSGLRTASTVQPVLTTTVDDYVRMVVPAESYASWPLAALSAQAVAARTYALSTLSSARTPGYDICSSTRCQVVGSISAETARTRQAVADTAGVVLTRGGLPVRAEFSSTNGGYTVDGGVAHLPAQADPFDLGPLNPLGAWTASVPVSRLAAAYPGIGRITGVQVLTRDGRGQLGGRVLTARVIGELGTRTTTGDQLRIALGASVRSTLFAPVAAPSRTAAGGVGVFPRVARPTATSTLTLRLARSVGELDANPGPDVVALTGDGHLRLLSGVPAAPGAVATTVGLAGSTDLGGGFGDVTAVMAARDLDGDRQRDLVVRRGDGRLQRLTSDGAGGLVHGAPVQIGWGWAGFLAVTVADVTGDGRDDVLGLLPDGTVRAYPSTGRDGFTPARTLGRVPGLVDLTSQGDLTADGVADLVGLDATGRTLRLQVRGGALTTPAPMGQVSARDRLL